MTDDDRRMIRRPETQSERLIGYLPRILRLRATVSLLKRRLDANNRRYPKNIREAERLQKDDKLSGDLATPDEVRWMWQVHNKGIEEDLAIARSQLVVVEAERYAVDYPPRPRDSAPSEEWEQILGVGPALRQQCYIPLRNAVTRARRLARREFWNLIISVIGVLAALVGSLAALAALRFAG